MIEDTIAAISTALAPSGVAVIRISGNKCLEIARDMFKPVGKVGVCDFEPNKMYVGEIFGEGFADFGMCVYFKAPKSFTGEDSVEFHSHGGIAIVKGILSKILSLGARLANNGEFTKRAFMNGKLSLASCEGLIDMINSESISGVKAGYSLYREKLTDKIISLQDILTDAISEIDVDIDFPEEGLEKVSTDNVKVAVQKVLNSVGDMVNSYHTGRVLKDGVKVGIVGKPNVGKSSVLNALLNFDKAIVSDIAGTTRDIVEGNIDINGIRFYFSDTAGIRDTSSDIERLGVGLSKKIIDESDVILFVMDASDIDGEDDLIYNLIKDKNSLTVINKSDKSDKKDDRATLYISAFNGNNLDKLKQELFSKAVGSVDLNSDYLCEERHFYALKRAEEKLQSAFNGIDVMPLDLIAIDIKDAWDALGEISGKTATEDIINNIFSKFCVGK